MPGFCEGNIVADMTACPEYSSTNPSAPADSKINPGSSNDRVDIFVARECMSRPHWQLPATVFNITEARTEYLYRVVNQRHLPRTLNLRARQSKLFRTKAQAYLHWTQVQYPLRCPRYTGRPQADPLGRNGGPGPRQAYDDRIRLQVRRARRGDAGVQQYERYRPRRYRNA